MNDLSNKTNPSPKSLEDIANRLPSEDKLYLAIGLIGDIITSDVTMGKEIQSLLFLARELPHPKTLTLTRWLISSVEEELSTLQ